MSLFFDMKELTSFAQNKSSSAGIDSYDDTCNERIDLRSDWISKMFRRHFLEYKMSDPEAKLYNSRILDRLKRWCGAHGCAAAFFGISISDRAQFVRKISGTAVSSRNFFYAE